MCHSEIKKFLARIYKTKLISTGLPQADAKGSIQNTLPSLALHFRDHCARSTLEFLLRNNIHPPPQSCGRGVTEFCVWAAHEAQLRCPGEVDGDIWIWSTGRGLKPKFYWTFTIVYTIFRCVSIRLLKCGFVRQNTTLYFMVLYYSDRNRHGARPDKRHASETEQRNKQTGRT
jgi:hypothetical protein